MKSIFVDTFPPAVGPYCHAMRVGNLLFISGQVPIDPKTGNVVGKDMASQTRQTMENLGSVLKYCGLDFINIAKTTVYVSDIDAFTDMNTVYSEFMGDHKPARACVEISRLVKDMLVEIEAIAVYSD